MMTQSMYTPSAAQPAPSNSRRSAEREALGAAKAARATSATALDKSGEGESKKEFSSERSITSFSICRLSLCIKFLSWRKRQEN